ncbi:MAG: hypothetical protein AMXMBFR84_06970 [Candidatus Hydrogenedentota bacterium]
MLAGLLVSLVVSVFLCPNAGSLSVARAVAMGTIAMGFGGTMTYGQTLGLTQNPEVIGNGAALCWGLIGCAIKGGIWIAFAGAFLGMGLSGVRYRSRDLLFLMLAALGAYYIGFEVLNQPFNPRRHELPWLYFSSTWELYPNKDPEPRMEYWGGLLFALATVLIYAGWHRKDRLALCLGLWGLLGGAIGFPLGQCLQAYHAWNPEVFQQGIWVNLDPHMNWWNWMETTFGFTMGATLGLGAWIHRARIKPEDGGEYLPLPVEWILVAAHVSLLVGAEFLPWRKVATLYDLGLILGTLPLMAVAGGRWWPFLMALPITLIPYSGKTLLELSYEKAEVNPTTGWILYVTIPIFIATAAAFWFATRANSKPAAITFAAPALLLCTWTYFLLNWFYFRFPWPWAEWSNRTPNGMFFTVCAIGLTVLAIAKWPRKQTVTL